jgi:tetratricopeptide (TPR) repeat protein
LLEGVHLDSAEFEEWLAGHRDRLTREYLGVLERLERWSELAALEPLSARWTLELMKAQATANDRAGAIRTGERFQARLREEMGLGPDPAVASRLAQLRQLPPAPVPRPDPPLRLADPKPAPAAAPGAAPRAPRRAARAAVLGIGILAAGLAAWLATRPAAGSPRDPSLRIAVFPFSVSGDSTLVFLQDGIVDLLSADLDGVGAFSSVDPHSLLALVRRTGSVPPHDLARQIDAERYVVGTVYGSGDSIRIHALMHEASGGALIREARATGLSNAVPSLVDRITAQLVAGELGASGQRIASVAAQTTLSIPALREFLAGEAAFRRGRFETATSAYRRAVELDTTFALAHYRLALSILWGNQPGAETAFHDSLALRHADRLSPRDRDLVHAYAAWRSGRALEAWRRYDAIVARHPDDVEAWYQRGETEFHYGPRMGLRIADARVAFNHVVSLDPGHWGARWHLALLDAHERRVGGLRTRVIELLALEPDSTSAIQIQLVAGTGPDGRAPSFERAGELELFGAAWRRAVYLHDLDGARALFLAMQDIGRSDYSRLLGQSGLGELALARGRWAEALSEWDSHPLISRFQLQVAVAILPGFERPAPEREELERRLLRWMTNQGGLVERVPGEASHANLAAALLAASRGDTARALHLARRADSFAALVGPRPGNAPGRVVRAYLAYRQAGAAVALESLGAGEPSGWYGHALTSAGEGQSFERFLRAELLRVLRRPEEALRWYAGFGEHAVYDLTFLVPALLRSAELNQQLGRPSLATEQLGRAAALWRDADAVYRDMLARQVSPAPPGR